MVGKQPLKCYSSDDVFYKSFEWKLRFGDNET